MQNRVRELIIIGLYIAVRYINQTDLLHKIVSGVPKTPVIAHPVSPGYTCKLNGLCPATPDPKQLNDYMAAEYTFDKATMRQMVIDEQIIILDAGTEVIRLETNPYFQWDKVKVPGKRKDYYIPSVYLECP